MATRGYGTRVGVLAGWRFCPRCASSLDHRGSRVEWDVPGGFLEEAEDPLAGLRRELFEETGVEIVVGRFVGAFTDTYGNGPDANAVLNLLWEAKIARGEPVAADDVSELRWFSPVGLPADGELAFRWLAPFLRGWASAA